MGNVSKEKLDVLKLVLEDPSSFQRDGDATDFYIGEIDITNSQNENKKLYYLNARADFEFLFFLKNWISEINVFFEKNDINNKVTLDKNNYNTKLLNKVEWNGTEWSGDEEISNADYLIDFF